MTDTTAAATAADHDAAVTDADDHVQLPEHPSERQYVGIAAILAAVTAVEVGLYYIDLPDLVMVFALLALAIVKFTMVVAFFMHLKFDNVLFRRLFYVGLALAIGVYTIVLLTFHVFVEDTRLPRAGEATETGEP